VLMRSTYVQANQRSGGNGSRRSWVLWGWVRQVIVLRRADEVSFVSVSGRAGWRSRDRARYPLSVGQGERLALKEIPGVRPAAGRLDATNPQLSQGYRDGARK